MAVRAVLVRLPHRPGRQHPPRSRLRRHPDATESGPLDARRPGLGADHRSTGEFRLHRHHRRRGNGVPQRHRRNNRHPDRHPGAVRRRYRLPIRPDHPHPHPATRPRRALGDRPAGDRELSIKRKATKIVLRWAIGGAVGMLLSWPVLLGLALLLLVVIILSSAGGPAALAPPALAASNYSCTIAAPPPASTAAAVTPATAAAVDAGGGAAMVQE